MSRRSRIINSSIEYLLNIGNEEDENNESSGQTLRNRFQEISRANVLSRLRDFFERRNGRRLYDDYSVDEDMENAIYNSNENFKQFSNENDINFRNYPFPINWIDIENDENEFYNILSEYGFFGASIYTSLYKINKVSFHNLIDLISEMFYNYSKKENFEMLKDFIFSLSQTPEMIYQMIKNKLILVKEIPVYFIILIIYEIFYFKFDDELFFHYKKQKFILNSQFILINMINDNEYKTIYNRSFKGKPFRFLSKLNYKIQKERKKYLRHIKKMNKELVLLQKGFEKDKFFL